MHNVCVCVCGVHVCVCVCVCVCVGFHYFGTSTIWCGCLFRDFAFAGVCLCLCLCRQASRCMSVCLWAPLSRSVCARLCVCDVRGTKPRTTFSRVKVGSMYGERERREMGRREERAFVHVRVYQWAESALFLVICKRVCVCARVRASANVCLDVWICTNTIGVCAICFLYM